jgi:hypothetical protein
MKAIAHLLPVFTFNLLDIHCPAYDKKAEDNNAEEYEIYSP